MAHPLTSKRAIWMRPSQKKYFRLRINLSEFQKPARRRRGPAKASGTALALALATALRQPGRKRVHTADEVMARITAERLVQHLEQSGY